MAYVTPKDKPRLRKDGTKTWLVTWKEGGRGGCQDQETCYDHLTARKFGEMVDAYGQTRPEGYPKGCHGKFIPTELMAKPARRVPTFEEYARENILGPVELGADGQKRRDFEKRGRQNASVEVCEDYIADLELHFFPVIGKRPINEITRGELLELIRNIADKDVAKPPRRPFSDGQIARRWALVQGMDVPKRGGPPSAQIMLAWTSAGSPRAFVYETDKTVRKVSAARIDRLLSGSVKPVFRAAERAGDNGEDPWIRHGYNPCDGLTVPPDIKRRTQTKRRDIVRGDVSVYFDALLDVNESGAWLIQLGLATGMRWGELTGLSVRNVDLDAKVILVDQVLARKKCKGCDKDEKGCGAKHLAIRKWPKNDKSIRYVAITDAVARILAFACEGKGPEDLVFTTPNGLPWNHSNFTRDVLDKAEDLARSRGFLQHVTPHMLRHSVITHLRDGGVAKSLIEAFAGHSEKTNTNAGYMDHVTPSQHDVLRAALEPLGDLFAASLRRRAAVPAPRGARDQRLEGAGRSR